MLTKKDIDSALIDWHLGDVINDEKAAHSALQKAVIAFDYERQGEHKLAEEWMFAAKRELGEAIYAQHMTLRFKLAEAIDELEALANNDRWWLERDVKDLSKGPLDDIGKYAVLIDGACLDSQHASPAEYYKKVVKSLKEGLL